MLKNPLCLSIEWHTQIQREQLQKFEISFDFEFLRIYYFELNPFGVWKETEKRVRVWKSHFHTILIEIRTFLLFRDDNDLISCWYNNYRSSQKNPSTKFLLFSYIWHVYSTCIVFQTVWKWDKEYHFKWNSSIRLRSTPSIMISVLFNSDDFFRKNGWHFVHVRLKCVFLC